MPDVVEEKHYILELIGDFVEYLEIEKGRSKKTAENYQHYLERFLYIAGELTGKDDNLEPSDINDELLRKFRLKLNRLEDERGQGLEAITQAYHLIALRGFLKYLARRHIKSLDPSLVELPHIIRKQVTFLHYDEVESLLEQIDTSTETGLRDRSIIELLFSGGLRV